MPTAPELPKGYSCECGKYHEFPSYVFAHWRDRLTHTCNDCGNQHTVIQGRVSLLKKGKKHVRKA